MFKKSANIPPREDQFGYVPLILGIFLPSILFVKLLFSWYNRKQRFDSLGTSAPAVPWRFPFGLDLPLALIKHIKADTFVEWSKNTLLKAPGHTVEIRFAGQRIVFTDNPDNVRTILSSKFSSYGKGEVFHKIWHDLMLDSVFSMDAEARYLKKLYLRPHTSKLRPTDYEITEKHAKTLIEKLSDDQPHDCFDAIDRFSFDTISEIFFGSSAGTLLKKEQPIRDTVEKLYIANTYKQLLGSLGGLLPANKGAMKIIDDYLNVVIDTTRRDIDTGGIDTERKRQTLLGSMILNDSSPVYIKDQLMPILLGGKDPASLTITWALYRLATHPSVIERLRDEIKHTVGTASVPGADHLRNMPFLQSIVKETLRLHPPSKPGNLLTHLVGFNVREALADTTLPSGGGPDGSEPVAVPKGTHLAMANICLQRRVDLIGPDAELFVPDRWSNGWKPPIWAYLPFNHGPNVCLGKNFAIMQMEYILCRLFQAFRSVEFVGVEGRGQGDGLNEKGEVGTRLAFNTKPAGSILLRFVK